MDPNAAWTELCELLNQTAFADVDAEECHERALALSQWVDSGGFQPVVTGSIGRVALGRLLDALCAWLQDLM